MIFRIERTFLIKTEENVELDPKKFLHCSNIEELNEEVGQYIYDICKYPEAKGIRFSEELETRYWDNWFNNDNDKSFYIEWQKLKGLPAEL